MTSNVDYPTIYVTRYMGAKGRLLDLIVPRIEEVLPPGGTLVDLMSGTQSIGYALKSRNLIVSNDVQLYASVFAHALVVNRSVRCLTDRVDSEIRQHLVDEATPGWFTETYEDTYFAREQCIEIEQLRAAISLVTDPVVRDLYLTLLSYAMAHCQSTPGHFAQFLPSDHPRVLPLRQLSVIEAFFRRVEELEVNLDGYDNCVFQLDARNLIHQEGISKLAPPGSAAYLDPPYSSAQYSRFYHLLDTVFLDDRPEVRHKARYRTDRYQSPFCYPTRAPEAVDTVVEGCARRRWNLVASYSTHGVMSVEEMLSIMRRHYRSVTMHSREYVHSTLGKGSVRDRRELVFTCTEPRPSGSR